MVLKNVKCDWIYIQSPDENGNYRIAFEVDEAQKAEIDRELEAVAKENGTTLDKCDWKGSYKLTEQGKHTYGAKSKALITTKTGEQKQIQVPVFNIHAQRIASEDVPSIANGAIMNLCLKPYFAKYKSKKGVQLGLQSVQLIKYEIYGGLNPFSDESSDAPFDSAAGATDDAPGEDLF